MLKHSFKIMIFCIGIAKADDLSQQIATLPFNNPELLQEVKAIIDNPALEPTEKLSLLFELQENGYQDVQEKILHCIDTYTDMGMQLEENTDQSVLICPIENGPEMKLGVAADAFKVQLLHVLANFDAVSQSVVMFVFAQGMGKSSDLKPLPFYMQTINKVLSLINNRWVKVTSAVGIGLCLYRYIYTMAAKIRYAALERTPISDAIECEYGDFNDRKAIFIEAARRFPPQYVPGLVYEVYDDGIVYISSIEALLVAAQEEERLLRTYLRWETWARRFLVKWLLPFSDEDRLLVEDKLEKIVFIQDIV